MLPTFVIGLREGLEGALIVGIVAAFLARNGRRDALRQVWAGVAAAVALCIAVGVGLDVLSHDLPQRQQEGLETIIGVVALAMVTYMVAWMRKHSRSLKAGLEQSAGAALESGSARALVMMAFLAVLREGFETSVFLLATFQHSSRPLLGGIGALLGLVIAVGIGAAIYRGGLRLNLARFFRLTGLVLVFIAAGLLMAAFHTAHEAGWVNVGQQQAADLTWLVRPGSVQASLVTGVLGFQPRPTVIEVVAWFAYLVPMLVLVAWSPGGRRRSRAAAAGTGPVRAKGAVARSTAAVVAALVVLTGCGSSSAGKATTGGGAATKVAVALTSGGCAPNPASVPSGPVEFSITNESADAVTEAELTTADRRKILGEKENLTPGLSGSFTLTLAAGTYQMVCPNASTEHFTFTVTRGRAVSDWHANPTLVTAVDRYDRYVRDQTARLVSATKAFAAAVKGGDLDAAKAAYGRARLFYERIEPVAESFGDLDPLIDGRAGDADTPADFTGFHRIEKALWVDRSLAGTAPVADRLVADVGRLQALVAGAEHSPAEMARGAGELIDEIQASKITGEEERYSHLDLLDFAGNLDGAMKVVDLLRPSLRSSAPELLTRIDRRAAAVRAALARFAAEPGYEGSGYVDYSTVTTAQRRALSNVVNALGAEISEVAVKVTA